MTTLYVYRQIIEFLGTNGSHLTFSENPPEECTLTEATCLGKFELESLSFNDSTGGES